MAITNFTIEHWILLISVLTLAASIFVPFIIEWKKRNARTPKPVVSIGFDQNEPPKYRVTVAVRNARSNHIQNLLTLLKYPNVIPITWDKSYRVGNIEKTSDGSTVTIVTDLHINTAPTVIARGTIELKEKVHIPFIIQVQADYCELKKFYGYIKWEDEKPLYQASSKDELISLGIFTEKK